MKKVLIAILCISVLIFVPTVALAQNTNTNTNTENIKLSNTTPEGELVEIQEKSRSKIAEYEELYGSKSYGVTAYILNGIRIYSIPLCFIGIAVGAIYQYVLGIRKLDVRDKGLNLIVTFVTILVICQVLPLVFTVVVKSWRG